MDLHLTNFQERLRSLHRLIYDIDGERGRNEQCIESILRAEKAAESPPANEDSSSSSQQVIIKIYLWMVNEKFLFYPIAFYVVYTGLHYTVLIAFSFYGKILFHGYNVNSGV